MIIELILDFDIVNYPFLDGDFRARHSIVFIF